MFTSSKWPISFRFQTLHTSLFSNMPYPSPHPQYDHPKNIWWRVQIMKLLIMQLYPTTCYFLYLRTKIFVCTVFSESSQLFHQYDRTGFTSFQNTGKLTFLYVSVSTYCDKRRNNKTIMIWMVANIPWISLDRNFFMNVIDLTLSFPDTWTLSHFQRIYWQSPCCDNVRHFGDKTWTYTMVVLYNNSRSQCKKLL